MGGIDRIPTSMSKNFQNEGIKCRPDASPGLWMCIMLPLAVIVYGMKHNIESSVIYKLCGLLSFQMLLTSLTCISKCYRDRHLNHALKWHAVTTVFCTGLYGMCLQRGIAFSVYSSLVGTVLYRKIYGLILTHLPYSFTIGEADVVSQAVTLFLYSTSFNIYNAIHTVPSKTSDIATILMQLEITAIGTICLFMYKFKSLQKPYLFYVVSGSIIFIFVIMIHIVLRRSPILWLIYFIWEDSLKLKMVMYWGICSTLAYFITRKQIQKGRKASTRLRKAYHILAVAVYLPGILYECTLLYLASGLVLGLFIFLETLRVLNIPPLADGLQDGFVVFCDEKDAGHVALTPIYLLAGCSLPLWLHPAPCDITDSGGFNTFSLLSGILSIGIGDTMAAIIGASIGKHKWSGSLKTIEGTVSCVLSQLTLVAVLLHFRFLMINPENLLRVALVTIITALIEAATTQIDNLVLPLVAFIILV